MDIKYIPGDLVMVKESALQFAKDKIFKVISSLSGGFVKVVMLNNSSTTVRRLLMPIGVLSSY
nr:hypothetical protein [uncultured Prevotella sp.]